MLRVRPEDSRIEEFLVKFANLPGDPIGEMIAAVNQTKNPFDEQADQLLKKVPEFLILGGSPEQKRYAVRSLALHLRTAWRSPDPNERQWYLFGLRLEYAKQGEPKREAWKMPPLTPFEYAMRYADNHASRLRFCSNPDCPHPYYISPTTKATKYCSVPCATTGIRKSKLNYYHANRARKGA